MPRTEKACSSYTRHLQENEVRTECEWFVKKSPGGKVPSCGNGVTIVPTCPPKPSCQWKPSVSGSNCVPMQCTNGNGASKAVTYINATDHSSVKIFVNGKEVEDNCDKCCHVCSGPQGKSTKQCFDQCKIPVDCSCQKWC